MSYKLIIGTKNWSTWSLRAWLALKVPNIVFEEILIPLRRPESAAAIKIYSPSQRVPVLQITEEDEDSAVFDSLAICETIAERHPGAKLWPNNSTVRSLARSYSNEMHSGFLALREALPMDFSRNLPTPVIDSDVQSEINRIQSAWEYALSRYSCEGGFLFGKFSIADCMYAPVVSRFLTYGIPMSGVVSSYASRISKLPAMQEWLLSSKYEVENGLPDQWVVDMIRNAR